MLLCPLPDLSLYVWLTWHRSVTSLYPHFYPVATSKTTTNPLYMYFFSGDEIEYSEYTAKPGTYYEGDLKVQASGTGHDPSSAHIKSRARDKKELNDTMSQAAVHAARYIKADSMLPGLMGKLSITYS
jgi:hypothetical protein